MRPRTIIHVCSELLLLCLENNPLHSSDPPDIKIKFQNPPPPGLESDGSRFSMRKDGQSRGDPSCKLCGSALEDATHFLHHAGSYIAKRRELLCSPPQPWDMDLTDPACEPDSFACIMLGIGWESTGLMTLKFKYSASTL